MWIRRVGASVDALAYSPDSRTLYTVEGGRVSAWDLASRQPTRLFPFAHHSHASFATPDGRYFVCHASSASIVWDLHKQKQIRKLPRWFTAPVPAPHGPTIRFLAHDGKTIKAFDPSTKKTQTLFGPLSIGCWAFTADDRKLLLSDYRGTMSFVDRATGTATPFPPSTKGMPITIRFSPDGNSLVLVRHNHLEIWDATTLTVRVAQLSWNPAARFAFHPRAPIVATGSGGNVTLFSLLTGEPLRMFQLDLGRWVTAITFSPDGSPAPPAEPRSSSPSSTWICDA